jgi:hypothetical protein
LSKTFEEKTEEEEQTQIIDTGIAAGSVDRRQQLTVYGIYLFSQLLKNYK